MRIFWNGGSGNFALAGNWSPTFVPGAFDRVFLPNNGVSPYAVTWDSAVSQKVLSLQTDASATLIIDGSDLGRGLFMQSGTGTGVNAGIITVDHAGLLGFGGTVRNTGTIELKDALLSGAFTLRGHGEVTMADLTSLVGGDVINVDNVISGAGFIGAGFINRHDGVIRANANGGVPLTVGEGSGFVINAGLIEATGALSLTGIVRNTGGVIRSDGTNATVGILDATISGGKLETVGMGLMLAVGDTTLDGTGLHPVTNAVTNGVGLEVTTSADLHLLGTIHNIGTIALHSETTAPAELLLDANVTLDGKGTISLLNFGPSLIGGGTSDVHVTLNNIDNTIRGTGDIGGADFSFLNQKNGIVNAHNTDEALVLDTQDNVIMNAGLLEAINGGELFIGSALKNVIGLTAGKLLAAAGTITIEGVSTGGSATIQNNGTLEFGDAATTGVKFIDPLAGENTLILDNSAKYTGKITGFGANEVIDLTDIEFGAVTLSVSSTRLTIDDHSAGPLHTVAHLNFATAITLPHFSISGDLHGGTELLFV